MAFITNKMYLMSQTYCEVIRSVIEKIGISDSAVIAKLMPRYKYKNENGVEVGKDRCDRFMYWSKWRWYNEDDYYDRCKAVEDYVRLIYPRLVREVAKEEAKAKFLSNLETHNVRTEAIKVKVIVSNKQKQKEKGDSVQMEFDFGGNL